ncbi:MAG: hypothetical protein H7Y00_16750 [Fimbriimonadaceae bacterium]|nr:hypothetical protein [Chitinophagales bacterium]
MIDPNSPQAQQYINSMETAEYKEILLADAEKKVSESRTALYAIAGLSVVGGVVSYFIDKVTGLDILIGSLIIALVFLVLAFFVNKKPKLCVLTGLILYCTLLIIDAIADPSSLIKGILVKGIIIYFLIKGFKAAREVEEMRAKLSNLETMKEEDKPIDQI